MRLRVLPVRWIGLGCCRGGTGRGLVVFGYPFLTAYAQYVTLPLIGDVPAATALLFDLGVFALVVGATVLMLIAIAHQSLRAAPPATTAMPPTRGGRADGTDPVASPSASRPPRASG